MLNSFTTLAYATFVPQNDLTQYKLLRYEQCKSLLGTAYTHAELISTDSFHRSRICLIRALVNDRLGCPDIGKRWHVSALQHDSTCSEAINAIFCTHRLSAAEQTDVINMIHQSGSTHPFISQYVRICRTDGRAAEGTISDKSPYIASSDVQVALAARELAVSNFDTAAAMAEKVFTKHPGSANAVDILIPCYLAKGDKGGLHHMASRLQELCPDAARTWLVTGCYYSLAKEYNKALPYLNRAVELEPRNGSALIALGRVHSRLDQSEEAVARFRLAASALSGSPDPLVHLGVEYLKMGDVALAGRYFHKAHGLAPADPTPVYQMGIAAYLSGNLLAAQQHLQAVAELTRSTTQPALHTTRHLALLHLAHVLRRRAAQTADPVPLLDQAKAMYTLSLRLNPTSHRALAGLAMCVATLGDLHHATRLLMAALDQEPTYAPYVSMLNHVTQRVSLDPVEMPPPHRPPTFMSSSRLPSAAFPLSASMPSIGSAIMLDSATSSRRTPLLRTPVMNTPELAGSGLLGRPTQGSGVTHGTAGTAPFSMGSLAFGGGGLGASGSSAELDGFDSISSMRDFSR